MDGKRKTEPNKSPAPKKRNNMMATFKEDDDYVTLDVETEQEFEEGEITELARTDSIEQQDKTVTADQADINAKEVDQGNSNTGPVNMNTSASMVVDQDLSQFRKELEEEQKRKDLEELNEIIRRSWVKLLHW